MSHYTVTFQSGILHLLKAMTRLGCKIGTQATENMDWDLKKTKQNYNFISTHDIF